jgi:ketosteroid isomerase-like protein
MQSRRAWLVIALLGQGACASAPRPVVDRRAEIEAFNRALIEGTLKMDTDGLVALFDDDSVSLLPQTAPLVGKAAISAFVHEVEARHPGAHMKSFELTCTGITVSGDEATEYCDEHQIVDLPGGEPPFDGRGKLLYVLRRGADGKWRIVREMWNQGVVSK